jgi:hypothetical protein
VRPIFPCNWRKRRGSSQRGGGGGEFNSVTRRRWWRIMITYCCLNSYISARVSNSSEIIGAYEAHFRCDMLSLSQGGPRGAFQKTICLFCHCQSVRARPRVCVYVCVHHLLYTYRGTQIIAWRACAPPSVISTRCESESRFHFKKCVILILRP